MPVIVKRVSQAAAILLLTSVVGWIGGFLLTPLLWQLEEPLGLELAGHSGPADWVLWTAIAITGMLGLGVWSALIWRGRRRHKPAEPQ